MLLMIVYHCAVLVAGQACRLGRAYTLRKADHHKADHHNMHGSDMHTCQHVICKV